MFDAELAAALATVRSRALIVATRHFAAHRGSSPTARLVGRLLTKVVVEQLAISDFVAAAIEGTSIVVAPGVPDVVQPTAAAERNLEVLLVQRLEQEKGTEVGLEAFARSTLASRGWTLVIAGDGSEKRQLQLLSERLGVAESCRFLGAQSDVESLYRRAAIFLATRAQEPFGISVVEAMAHGLPVIATASGGHHETVGLCAEARLFPPGDAGAAARLLVELADDFEARSRYGALLRDVQQTRFTVERQARRTSEIYRSVIAKDPR